MPLNTPRISSFLLLLFFTTALAAQQAPNESKRVDGISTDKFTEFAPTISADGKTMIIESNRNSKREQDEERWELFESIRNADGTWGEGIPISTINEKCNFLAGPSLSYDGNQLFFTAFIEGVTTSEDIFYSERINETQWSEPINLGEPINTEDYEGFPSISANGNSLYFIRINYENPLDRKSRENCFEIYVSHKQPDGKWGTPEKLPEQINKGCVRDPRIMADNHTLIFSAIVPEGKGKYDLFQTRKNSDGTWAEAKPLDFINSEENDQSPTISAAGDIIFYYTKKDIYAMTVPPEYRQMINVTVQGFVRAEKGAGPLAAIITMKNLDTGEIESLENNPNDGRFSLILSAGSRFRVEFRNALYLKEVRDFDLRKQETYKQIDLDVNLKSNYHATIVAIDHDLKTPVTSFVHMADQHKNLIYNDSLRPGHSFQKVSLETANQYEITATAHLYPSVKKTIVFDSHTFRPDTTFSLSLTHDKSRFLAEITDISTKQRVKTKVTFNNLDENEVLLSESEKSVLLRRGDRYQVVTSSENGYFFSTVTIVAGEGEVGPDGIQRIQMLIIPIQEGASLTLNNINFETASSDLKPTSFPELDRVIELMNQNPTVTIEIAAHTDDVGVDDYNIKLSMRRAQSVVVYLNKKGVKNTRFVAKGYGKNKPLLPNDSDENRALNRRVELVILKI
ncbi:MAG: OmpA family protein [Bacteroidota bacterium]